MDCTAASCQTPATHYVGWMEVLTWNLSARSLAPRPAKRRKRVNVVCAGHAAVITAHVHDGGAARHNHTPVCVSGPYDPDALARKVRYELTGKWQ